MEVQQDPSLRHYPDRFIACRDTSSFGHMVYQSRRTPPVPTNLHPDKESKLLHELDTHYFQCNHKRLPRRLLRVPMLASREDMDANVRGSMYPSWSYVPVISYCQLRYGHRRFSTTSKLNLGGCNYPGNVN